MATLHKDKTYVDLAYNIGNSKCNRKLVIGNTKIYIIVNENILVSSFNEKENTLCITDKTPIEDVIDFTFLLVGNNTVDIVESDIENLTVDRIEGIYYTVLTEDNHSIVLSESNFNFTPKDGDLVDGNLNFLEKETISKKTSINNKFHSLLKNK